MTVTPWTVVLDPLEPPVVILATLTTATEDPLSEGGKWGVITGAANAGRTTIGEGWHAEPGYPSISGAVYLGLGESLSYPTASVEIAKFPAFGFAERCIGVWTCLSLVAESGYLLRAEEEEGSSTEGQPKDFHVTLERWVGGVKTILATVSKAKIGWAERLALSCLKGGELIGWIGEREIIHATDSTFSSGYGGIMAIGNNSRCRNFSFGNTSTAPGARTPLNLNSGLIAVDGSKGINWGTAEIHAWLAEAKYGESQASFRVPNRVVEIPLMLGGTFPCSEAEEEEARAQLQQKIGLLQRAGGTLLRQRENGEPLYADIVYASLTVPDQYGEEGAVEPDVILLLTCLPDFYGTSIQLTGVTDLADFTAVLESGGQPAVIRGDYPARSQITFTDTSGHTQRSLLWGLRSTYYSPAATAELIYDAITFLLLNGATHEAHSGTYAGEWAILKEPAVATWHPMLETQAGEEQALSHLGTYRVWARVYAAGRGMKVRLAWSQDDATAPTYNPAVEIPGQEAFYLVDLGEIRLEPPPIGLSSWKGIIQVLTGEKSYAFAIDRFWLQPLDDGAGKLRATAVPTANLIGQTSTPSTASSNGSLQAGTAWDEPEQIKEGFSGMASVHLASLADSQALEASDFGFALPSGVTIHGIVVEATVRCDYSIGFLFAHLVSESALVGTAEEEVVISHSSNLAFGGASDLWGATLTVAKVNKSDFGVALRAENLTGEGSNPNLVYGVSRVKMRIYYSFSSSSPAVDGVLYADRHALVSFRGSYREDTVSESYVAVSEETGDLMRLPPSGLEGRYVELLVKNSRGLLPSPATNEDGESDPAIDAIEAVVSYRPCYLGRT
jgi:hypothetical protein